MKTELNVDGPAQGLIVIERTHYNQTVAGLALLNHLANSPGGCTFDELYGVFVQAKGGPRAPAANSRNLRSVLGHMVEKGYVAIGGSLGAQQRLYRLGDMDKRKVVSARTKAWKARDESRQTPALPAQCGMPAPPRQPDVMCGPVYAPRPSAAPRPGSLDFLRLASHGSRC